MLLHDPAPYGSRPGTTPMKLGSFSRNRLLRRPGRGLRLRATRSRRSRGLRAPTAAPRREQLGRQLRDELGRQQREQLRRSSGSGSAAGSSGSGSSSGSSSSGSSGSSSGGGTCGSCTTDSECQSSCPPVQGGGTNCCDTGSGVCYATTQTTCPSPVVDSGSGG